MDITKAKKVFELTREDRKILVTLWDGDRISSCVENKVEEQQTQKCESCQGDDKLCQEYVEHLVEQGYAAKEIQLGEFGIEESLPRFLEERHIMPAVEPSAEAEEVVE